MLHKLSEKISTYYINKNEIDISELDTYTYCFEVLLSTIVNMIIIILLAVLTKLYLETLCFTISFMALRGSAGGYHAKTHYSFSIGYVVLNIGISLLIGRLINFQQKKRKN